jgi:hypothetical protein
MVSKMKTCLETWYSIGKGAYMSRAAPSNRLYQDDFSAIVAKHLRTMHAANGAGEIKN